MSHVVFDSALGCAVQTRSCDHCFSRKIKCNRRTPCSSCLEDGTECRYARTRKKRRYIRPTLGSSTDDGGASVAQSQPRLDEHVDWINDSLESSTPGQAPQPDITTGTELAVTSAAALSPMRFGIDDTTTFDMGDYFYQASFLGVADFPAFVPPLALDMTESPRFGLSPPLPVLSSQNSKLDRLLYDSSVPQLIDVFLERLQQSMPFFTRSFLRQNVASQRHLHDHSFGSLVQAICSLVLLQPVQSQDKRPWPDREARADAHLALAVRLHSQADLGQTPTLETLMTSVFLFACQFCKGNFDAARFRLREAAALAEVMKLDKPDSYGHIGDTEKQRRIRTLISLTIIERIYSVQRDYIPGTNGLSRAKLRELQDAIASSSDRSESENIIAMDCISSMLEQVDFIDANMIKCWRGMCWSEDLPSHVSQSTIVTLLRRYQIPPQLSWLADMDTHAQHADILVTRHWIRIKLWTLANSHGYVDALSDDIEFRPEYALAIAKEALDTCSQFEMTSLEVHGVGLVEKLSDIATCAAMQIDRLYATTPSTQGNPSGVDLDNSQTSPPVLQDDSSSVSSGAALLLGDAESTMNGYLALFASFRRGKHPFLRPYMRLLGDINFQR
ncbi:hypothetical protein NLU13_0204 [Sarocladium strictum]|uniref:Zn(2)-C6 fungal-type domain-containing protein n=1 Tax=Sarocladium strictum TaxID=5046 RepID=A0AA39GPD4_SARSR|nr:hypothetical protein NLU13_0204 [Sarocladium strictum]